MTTRLLPREEWGRLVGTEAESLIPGLHPDRTSVLVVEDAQGQIVGTWLLLWMAHVECFWIAPEHRKRSRVGARLLAAMRTLLRQSDAPCPLTAAVSDDVATMIQRLGGIPLPGDHFALPIGGLPCRP